MEKDLLRKEVFTLRYGIESLSKRKINKCPK